MKMAKQKKITKEQLSEHLEKMKAYCDELAAFIENNDNWDANGVIADDTVPPGNPPPNPTSFPFAPITRWHGMTMGNGFLPFAAPTAREAFGFPTRVANSP